MPFVKTCLLQFVPNVIQIGVLLDDGIFQKLRIEHQIVNNDDHDSSSQQEGRLIDQILISSNQSFELLESISEAFYGLDGDWRFIYLNHKAEQLWGRKREDLIGKHIWSEFPQGVDTQAFKEMHRALHEQKTVRFESFSSFLGAWVEVEVYPMRTGLSVYFHDISQRKRAEEALNDSHNRLQLITDSLPILISYFDREMHYQFVNKGYKEWFGYNADQVTGKHIAEIIGQTAFETAKPDIENALNGQVVRYEHEMPYDKGTRLTRTQLLPQVLEDGTVVGVIAMVEDITEQKRIDERLARLAAIVSSSNDAIISEALDGTITSWNDGAEQIYGYSADEIIQKPISLLIPSDRLDEEKRFLQKIAANEIVKNYDTIRLKKDGTKVFVSVTLSPIKDEQGNIVGISKTAQDITERKRSEGALQRYAERLSAINRLDRVISSNLDLGQVYDNFVKELQGLIQLDRTAIVRLNETKDQWQIIRQWTQHKPAIQPGEWRSVNGSVIEWLVTNRIPYSEAEVGADENWPETAILQREGIRSRLLLPLIISEQVIGVLTVASRLPSAFSEDDQSILVTIADQLSIAIQNATLYEKAQLHATELEQHVAERTAKLEASNKELEAFSYSVSHDLRAPLRALDGFSKILLRDYAAQIPEPAERYLHLIRDNSQQMGTLIDDLLTFSRLNRQPLNKQTVNVVSMVNQVLEDLSGEQENRKLEIIIGDLPTCQADAALLKQVVTNLLSNALKFTRLCDMAYIEAGYQQINDENVYYIKDNGAGFDMAYADKLFGVFQRLHRSDEFPGTGVGLAIVQRIIRRHGGRVWAKAEVNNGATLYFTLEGGSADE